MICGDKFEFYSFLYCVLIPDLVFYFQLLYPNFTNQNIAELFFFTFVLGVLFVV